MLKRRSENRSTGESKHIVPGAENGIPSQLLGDGLPRWSRSRFPPALLLHLIRSRVLLPIRTRTRFCSAPAGIKRLGNTECGNCRAPRQRIPTMNSIEISRNRKTSRMHVNHCPFVSHFGAILQKWNAIVYIYISFIDSHLFIIQQRHHPYASQVCAMMKNRPYAPELFEIMKNQRSVNIHEKTLPFFVRFFSLMRISTASYKRWVTETEYNYNESVQYQSPPAAFADEGAEIKHERRFKKVFKKVRKSVKRTKRASRQSSPQTASKDKAPVNDSSSQPPKRPIKFSISFVLHYPPAPV